MYCYYQPTSILCKKKNIKPKKELEELEVSFLFFVFSLLYFLHPLKSKNTKIKLALLDHLFLLQDMKRSFFFFLISFPYCIFFFKSNAFSKLSLNGIACQLHHLLILELNKWFQLIFFKICHNPKT